MFPNGITCYKCYFGIQLLPLQVTVDFVDIENSVKYPFITHLTPTYGCHAHGIEVNDVMMQWRN